MNILVVSQYYFPEQFRINDICEDLVNRGHTVTVLTGLPNYPSGIIYDGYQNKAGVLEIINRVSVQRCKIHPRGNGSKDLFLNYLSFVYYGEKTLRKNSKQYDVVFVYQLSPITMAIPAIFYCKKNKVPLVLYCLDLWPVSVLDHKIKKDGLLYNLIKQLSGRIYRQCNKIIVSSPSFSNYISDSFGIERNKICYIPQHAESQYVSTKKGTKGNRKCLNFMFLGNIGYSQNCECIIEAANILRNSELFKIYFVGTGSRIDHLVEMVREYNLSDIVEFHGFQKKECIQKYYDLADVCILTLSNTSEIGLTIPAKLQSYMAEGKPIVASISGDAAQIIKEAGCGFCVEADDSGGLASCMKQMIDSNSIEEMGVKARLYFDKHFSRDVVIQEIESELVKQIQR